MTAGTGRSRSRTPTFARGRWAVPSRSDGAGRDDDPPIVPGYELGELLTTSPRLAHYRATEVAGGRPVVVRIHRGRWPSPLELARTRHAYDVGRTLTGRPGVVAHLALVPTPAADLALITAPVGTSLEQLLASRPGRFDLAASVTIAGGIAEALAEIHAAGVVHNRVSPASVVVDGPERVALGDFVEASRLHAEHQGSDALAQRTTDLRYVSPEQTGRMNRSVDSRSDLYALGIILFELLTGAPPFQGAPGDLVHAHIARPVPTLGREDVPPAVAAIVARLLSKNADDRYQEARGVAHDLRRCVREMAEGRDPGFRLGERDVGSQLRLPETLYGRGNELAMLKEALDHARDGRQELVFVSGYSGVGKSRLVAELQPATVALHGWFTAGKFDVFRRDVPYLAWVSAMGEAIRQALTLSDAALDAFRTTLVEALAGNGAAVTAAIPELELLLGEQPPLPEVPPGEAQLRFNNAVRGLVHAFGSAEHPLVVFLDDVQWADLPSLNLLEVVLTDPRAAHILVILSWRDNEVLGDHPLAASIRRVEDTGRRPVRIDLGPLAPADVNQLLTDALAREPDATAELAAVLQEKAGGNPFFLRRFIADLYRDGSLRFDEPAARWTWDLARIRARHITANVADLMAERIASFPPATQAVLRVASCLGVTFSVGDVTAAGDAPVEVLSALAPALAEGLVVPLDTAYRYATGNAGDGGAEGAVLDPVFSFLHDRVQETAHATMRPEERAAVHLRIARARLLAGAPGGGGDPVDVSSHLLQGLALIEDPDECVRAVAVLLRGARQARAAMAVDTARAFADGGLRLLPEHAWDHHRELALALFTEAAEIAYIQERFEAAETYCEMVLAHSNAVLERVAVHNVRIGIGVARADYHQATLYAVRVLADDFGIRLPRDPSLVHVLGGLGRVRLELRGQTTRRLLALPAMTDPQALAAMAILMKAATNAYWAIPNLVPLIAFRMIRLTLARGSTGLSAYGYALYGMIAAGVLHQVATGYSFGRLAMDLLARTGDRQLVGKTALLWHGFIRHARDPLRLCAADVLDAYHAAMDAGDVENATYCGTVAYYTDLLAGRTLPWLEERYAPYIEAMLASGQSQTIYALQVWLQAVANLRAPGRAVPELTGEHIEFEARLDELLSQGQGNAIPQGVSGAGWLAFMLDDMARAERHLGLLWAYRGDAPGQSFLAPCFALYAAVLERRRHATGLSPAERLRLARVRRSVEAFATTNPHDGPAFAAFVAAEHAVGSPGCAGAFLRAAELAETAGILYLEALATERAAQVHQLEGHHALAGHLLAEAAELWRRYGARARLHLLGRDDDLRQGSDRPGEAGLSAFDVQALLATARAVSSEIQPERLLSRVMQLALRNAGARHGVLVLFDEGVRRTVATALVADDGAIVVETSGPGLDRHRPDGVLDYVIRTRAPVVLDDALTDHVFGGDPYVVARRARSVLCTPLVRGGGMVGALFLANELGIGVFTEHHLAIVEAIGGQAAVSLENARLFEEQRSQAEAFTRFVPRPFLERLGHRRVADVRLGDAVSSDLVILFSDLRGFTGLSERLSARESFDLLNAYLACMEPVIHDHGGFIDKFIGDGVMALFADGRAGAVAAGVGMHRALDAFNAGRPDAPPLTMGIGLHAGPVMLGTVGGAQRIETTVIGDTVNTASRVEAMTKHYGAAMLVTAPVRNLLPPSSRMALRPVGRVRAMGKSLALSVYEVLEARTAGEAAVLQETATAFTTALTCWFEGNFALAAERFAACVQAAPFDGVAARYLALAQARAGSAPPEGWDGVDELTGK